ncbi:hypothetical protein OUZ56_015545 [Daphnia magna]|uniref:Uncharacterized protein n=1 Tax=Daphnia magna TaxID=35525 RepID=A0ABR0AN49_9CRUS|nr:hypothetical protein OUZ56_015545 [Daphnia magna]
MKTRALKCCWMIAIISLAVLTSSVHSAPLQYKQVAPDPPTTENNNSGSGFLEALAITDIRECPPGHFRDFLGKCRKFFSQ